MERSLSGKIHPSIGLETVGSLDGDPSRVNIGNPSVWKRTQCWQRGRFAKPLGRSNAASGVGTHRFRHAPSGSATCRRSNESGDYRLIRINSENVCMGVFARLRLMELPWVDSIIGSAGDAYSLSVGSNPTRPLRAEREPP